MHNKLCLVTGATHGIGLVTAQALATQGARVLLHGRDPTLVDAVTAQLRQRTGNAAVTGLVADFTSLTSVRRMTEQVLAQHASIDVLVNNAGGGIFEYRRTQDGFEWHFGVNYLAPVLLTHLLSPALQAGAARVVNVSSAAHKGQVLNINDLNFEQKFNALAAYGRSKFALNLFTFELARRMAGTAVTANALHPGVVRTNIFSKATPPMSWIMALMKPFMLSAEQGAQTSIFLATSSQAAGITGQYFIKCRAVPADPKCNDPELAGQLWHKTLQLLNLPA